MIVHDAGGTGHHRTALETFANHLYLQKASPKHPNKAADSTLGLLVRMLSEDTCAIRIAADVRS